MDEYMDLGYTAIKDYLAHIGIELVRIGINKYSAPTYALSHGSPQGYMGHYDATDFFCKCSAEDFEFFKKVGYKIVSTKIPVINRDALFGGLFSEEGPIESVFTVREEVEFVLPVRAKSLEDIDKFLIGLKTATEPLRERRFNTAMDEQITDELSST